MKHEESKLQIQCVNWFRLAHPKKLIYAIPNGGKRSYKSGNRMSAEGLTVGVPDLHIPIPNESFASLYIEMKSPKGRTRPDQKEMHTKLKELGNCVCICRSLNEFMDIVNNYLVPLKQ